MKTIVITRPREDSEKLAALLRERGFHTLIEPMLQIEALDAKEALEKALAKKPQAILVTSRHALEALTSSVVIAVQAKILKPEQDKKDSRLRGNDKKLDCPIIAVGTSTAERARALGFTRVAMAEGNAEALIEYTAAHCAPQEGPLLYLRGGHVTGDIEAALQQRGFDIKSVITYKALAADHLSDEFTDRLKRGAIDVILFFSERTAKIYLQHMQKLNLQSFHKNLNAICLSDKIAKVLLDVTWKNIAVVNRMDESALIEQATR